MCGVSVQPMLELRLEQVLIPRHWEASRPSKEISLALKPISFSDKAAECGLAFTTQQRINVRFFPESNRFSNGEFDPGSGRTLAACLTHASRTLSTFGSHERVANG